MIPHTYCVQSAPVAILCLDLSGQNPGKFLLLWKLHASREKQEMKTGDKHGNSHCVTAVQDVSWAMGQRTGGGVGYQR